MSYLIQNFRYPLPSLRYNLRLRAALLLRNSFIIISLILYPVKFNKLLGLNSLWLTYRRFIGFYLFAKLSKSALPKVKIFKYTPIGVNFPISAHASALNLIYSSLHALPPKVAKVKSTHSVVNSYITSPYYYGNQVYLTTLTHKPVKLVMYKFLFTSLNCWFLWSKRYRIPAQCFSVSSSWYLFKFLNVYFFKIYNV